MTREELMDNIVFSQKRWNSSTLDKIKGYVNKIFDEHEKELKQAWIDGSNANYESLKKAGKLK